MISDIEFDYETPKSKPLSSKAQCSHFGAAVLVIFYLFLHNVSTGQRDKKTKFDSEQSVTQVAISNKH